jgi:hypothetical protein
VLQDRSRLYPPRHDRNAQAWTLRSGAGFPSIELYRSDDGISAVLEADPNPRVL